MLNGWHQPYCKRFGFFENYCVHNYDYAIQQVNEKFLASLLNTHSLPCLGFLKCLNCLSVNSVGDVAQSVEHRTENPWAGGSSPLITTLRFAIDCLLSLALCYPYHSVVAGNCSKEKGKL